MIHILDLIVYLLIVFLVGYAVRDEMDNQNTAEGIFALWVVFTIFYVIFFVMLNFNISDMIRWIFTKGNIVL